MFDGTHWMWGMHWGWWIFWVLFIIVVVFLLRRPQTGTPSSPSRETPLETLQRRYAAGEISTDEYEERKARLEEDRT